MKRPVAASAAADAAENAPQARPIQARRVSSGDVSSDRASRGRRLRGAAAAAAAFAAAPPADAAVVVLPARVGHGAAGGRGAAAGRARCRRRGAGGAAAPAWRGASLGAGLVGFRLVSHVLHLRHRLSHHLQRFERRLPHFHAAILLAQASTDALQRRRLSAPPPRAGR